MNGECNICKANAWQYYMRINQEIYIRLTAIIERERDLSAGFQLNPKDYFLFVSVSTRVCGINKRKNVSGNKFARRLKHEIKIATSEENERV